MFKYFSTYFNILRKDKPFRTSLARNIRILTGKALDPKNSGENTPIIITLTEHMGDIVAAEPVARHLRKKHPNSTIIWSVNERFRQLTMHNPNIDLTITVSCIAEWILLKKIFSKKYKIYDLHLSGRSCSKYKLTNKNKNGFGIDIFNYLDHGNLLEVSAMSAGITDLTDDQPRFQLSKLEDDKIHLPYEYVVVHPLANDAERNWTPAKWNQLVNRLLESNPKLHVVEIGLESIIQSESHRFHNLTSRYSLQQLAWIINNASLFVGVESGFAHIANGLSVNSVIMIGYFQHYKNYQVYSGGFAEGKDCTLHYYQGRLSSMTVEEFWPSIERHLPKKIPAFAIAENR